MWAEDGGGEVILFRWTQFLLDETLTLLNVESPFPLQFKKAHGQNNRKRRGDPRAFQDVASHHNLVGAVLEYDQEEKRRVFSGSYFSCNVCFSEKPGSLCMNSMTAAMCSVWIAWLGTSKFRLKMELYEL